MNKIEVYTNDTCGYCQQVKQELIKKNIEFENKLTPDFAEEWQQIISLTGMPTVPTIKYNNEYFVAGRDFQNAQQMVNMLETFKESSFSESKKTLERMKTLNYNINMAFGKLDQMLRKIETKINKEDEHKSTS